MGFVIHIFLHFYTLVTRPRQISDVRWLDNIPNRPDNILELMYFLEAADAELCFL